MYPVGHRCSDCIVLMPPAFNIKGYSDKTLSFVMFGAASLWGLYWLPVRALAEMGIDGVWPVALMNLFPALCLTPFMLTLLIRPDSGVREAFWSGISVGIGFAFYTFAMLETTIVRATLLFYLTPIWSTLLGIFILSEPFTRTRAIAISVGLLGCFILLSPDQTASVALNIGDLYGLLAGGFWAIGATCIKRWPQSPALLITWFQLISTTLVALIFALLIYQTQAPDWLLVVQSLPITLGASVFILLPSTLLLMIISQVLYPGRVGVLMMSEVLVAIVSASLLVPEERMSLVQWGGAAAIIIAALFEVFSVQNKKTDLNPPRSDP